MQLHKVTLKAAEIHLGIIGAFALSSTMPSSQIIRQICSKHGETPPGSDLILYFIFQCELVTQTLNDLFII
jgi:hypothetical protein